ncbi:cation diffusion facilitator family transporter [Paenibacillus sp. MZ04-78.2]|uniref:cation diffusion facilitator family transporter n=1 Tax=Paenibacillus sp. MZ04-78.2 TaxID=2962034 RepID=UPI0020B864FC|nr:cation diffusion facilitator family transporter [Paenibacillus sp. MZ04-78.2]MCP3772924.1 cation diffusion facilitator family transporter [Paenibacillus sp. MZ04-78.2]
MGLWALLKKGNTSSLMAALGNTAVAFAKGIAAALSGSGAMYASAMHSVADAINQGFVFAGSVLAEKQPTRRFPTGFGRVINLFCMVAVMVVSFMAYETILEGFRLLAHPAEASNFWLNFVILLIAILIDGAILWKAMKEIVREARVKAKGLAIIPAAFRNVGRSAPPTRLVFYEDIVATLGAALALIAVIVTQLSDFKMLDGIATILIGFLMVGVAFKVGYDNMVGLIGVAAPKAVEDRVAGLLLADPDVRDINRLRILQEGRTYHVDGYVELRVGLTLADADDIKFRLKAMLLSDPDITDVTLDILEDNGVRDWRPELNP